MLFVADLSDAFLLKLKALKSTPAWANSLVDEKVESLAASIKNECEYYSLPARYEGLAKCLSDKTLETLKKTVAKTCGDFKPLNAVDILKVIPSFMTLLATWRHFFGKEKATACYIIIDILDNLVNKAVVFKKEWSPKAQEMIAKLEQDRKEQEAQEKEKKKEKKERRKQRKNAAVLEKDNQEATHEEVSRLKIQLEESRARAEKMSKQLQVDDFVPTHLPFIATHHKIKLPQHVVKLLTTLNQKGYWAVVVGGAVRDDLLGIEAKDYDIITNCLKTELAKTTKTHCTENSYIPGLFHVSHEATEKKVEIYCITCPLMEALQNRDFTINTFIADRHGKVYDLLRVIEHLKAKSLTLLGDPSQRLSDDPKKLFRLFNLSSRLQREIASEYLAPLKIAAKYITKRLAFSVYVKKIESLFLEGRAYDNIQILDFCGIREFMTPLPQKEFTIDLRGYEFYLACKLKEIDRKESQKQVSVCDILALLVLPWYLESVMPCTANGKSVEDVVDAFISAYEGSFLNTEKIALKNEMASLFRIYSAEYAEYQRSILALQKRAYQKSDKYLQRSQISLLSSELPSPVTFSYPKALSAANETSIDKLRDSFKACTLETSDKRQNPQLC
jgi:tRNA nucleotidyltransferase/poly(A) polymerase